MLKRKLSDIKIPLTFTMSTPNSVKLQECRDYWKKHKEQDRYLVVNYAGVLIDGYIQYLILMENNRKEAEIKISNCKKKFLNRKISEHSIHPLYRNEETTYIWGYHNCKNQAQTKEYIWRVPKSWSEAGWEKDLSVGDNLLVNTRFGIKFIKISRIERLAKCPVPHNVSKVYRKVER